MYVVSEDKIKDIFNGYGFVFSVMKSIPNLSYFSNESLEEVYFKGKEYSVISFMEKKEYQSESHFINSLCTVIKYSYYRILQKQSSQKRSAELVGIEDVYLPTYDNSQLDIENALAAVLSMFNYKNKRDGNHVKKISYSDRIEIFRKRFIEGYTNKELSEEYGVSTNSISQSIENVIDNLVKVNLIPKHYV